MRPWLGRLDLRRFDARISWPIFLFIAGMFVVVRAVENLGFTAAFGNALIRLAGGRPFPTVLLVAGGTAVGSNLINNVPMSLVMVSALRTLPTGIPAYHSLPFAAMLGADLGPNLTTIGSLATMVWLLILRRRGLEISTLEYFKLGVTFVPGLDPRRLIADLGTTVNRRRSNAHSLCDWDTPRKSRSFVTLHRSPERVTSCARSCD